MVRVEESVPSFPSDFHHVDRYHIKTPPKKSSGILMGIFFFILCSLGLVFCLLSWIMLHKSPEPILIFIVSILGIVFFTMPIYQYFELRDKLNTTAPLAIPVNDNSRSVVIVKNKRKFQFIIIGYLIIFCIFFLGIVVNDHFHPDFLGRFSRGIFYSRLGCIICPPVMVVLILMIHSNTVIITSEKVFISIKYLPFSPLKDKSVEYFFDDIVSCEIETKELTSKSSSRSVINKLVISYRDDQGMVCKSKVKVSLQFCRIDPCWVEFVINKLVGCEDREGFLESLSHLPQGLRVP